MLNESFEMSKCDQEYFNVMMSGCIKGINSAINRYSTVVLVIGL